MNIAERINKFVESEGITIAFLERNCGLSNGTIYRISKQQSTMTLTGIQKIKAQYPNLNLNWLISGEESMYCNTTSENDETEEARESVASYVMRITQLNDENLYFKKQLDALIKVVDRLSDNK
mgnify:CR=1 FL=1